MSLQVDMLVQVDEAQIPAQETPAEPLYSMAITGKHIILYGEKLQKSSKIHHRSTITHGHVVYTIVYLRDFPLPG
jgi:hypothetical protein